MALFAIWRDDDGAGPATQAALAGEAHVVAPHVVSRSFATPKGRWQLSAFATRTAFYAPDEQIWLGDGEACVLHGLIWRESGGTPRRLDAAAVAALLDRPGALLPADIAGEYAVVRLHRDGTLDAFGDAAGLHHIFYAAVGLPAVANRAGFLATLRGDWTADVDALIWLPTIGYRVGTRTAYRIATQLSQGEWLSSDGAGLRRGPLPAPIADFSGPRGADHRPDLFEAGLVQAQAAIRLATDGRDRIDLPITGGKDSRVVLACCLAAGLRDRLHLFTRGYEGHPDVVAGRAVAAALGLPHARQAPHGSDLPAHWSLDRFVTSLATQAYQTDGMMGGWDHIVGRDLGDEALITGHMGELLKAYSKRPLPAAGLDAVTMVRLQAPFDPLDLLAGASRAALVAQIEAQMAAGRAAGAEEADLPDLFYFQNRVPNWLGGIRGIKSFERQPVMPLGVPALTALAFRLTAAERKRELIHYRIVERLAPELLAPAFAMQSWDESLGDGRWADPIRPAADAPPVFGNWQYSLDSNPAIRAWLAERIVGFDHPLWTAIDRDRLLAVLRDQRIDYFQGIGLLGLVMALFGAVGIIRPGKLGTGGDPPTARPIAPATSTAEIILYGHLDAVTGAVAPVGPGEWRLAGDGPVTFVGWVFAPGQPAAQPAVELRLDGSAIALGVADRPRADLARAGIGDGRHGFALSIAAAELRHIAGKRDDLALEVAAFDTGFVPRGGCVKLCL